MKDISDRADIEFLIDEFYKTLKKDEKIGYFFTEVIEISWEEHIPVICDFWETVLFGNRVYSGNPMIKHIALNKKERLEASHFERWIKVWKSTIDKYFEGSKATVAIDRARNIASLMLHKVRESET